MAFSINATSFTSLPIHLLSCAPELGARPHAGLRWTDSCAGGGGGAGHACRAAIDVYGILSGPSCCLLVLACSRVWLVRSCARSDCSAYGATSLGDSLCCDVILGIALARDGLRNPSQRRDVRVLCEKAAAAPRPAHHLYKCAEKPYIAGTMPGTVQVPAGKMFFACQHQPQPIIVGVGLALSRAPGPA